MEAIASVVIPAHNEEDNIQDCLAALFATARPGELDVVVSCNGCTDRTAEVASDFASRRPEEQLRVIEVAEASKVAALNAGLSMVAMAPIIFLDADVSLSTAGARSLAHALSEAAVKAASTSIELQLAGTSFVSRSYHRFWVQLPSIANGLAGRGVYALSAEGLKRLGKFPQIIADDRYVDLLFEFDERRVVPESSTVAAAKSVRSLVDRKSRVFAGNNQLEGELHPERFRGFVEVIRENPVNIVDLPAYLLVNLVSKVLAHRFHPRGMTGWSRMQA